MAAPSSISIALTPRQRLGALLMLLSMALLTALFWAGVIRLILNA